MKIAKSILVISLFSLVLFSTSTVNAQDSDANVTITKVIDASADEVWGLLRKMDDINDYSSIIANVKWTGDHGVGGTRECYTPDGSGYFKEQIVSFDDTQRSYSYSLLEGVPAKGMINGFRVVDLGYKKSMIVWTSNYDAFLQNPQMTEEQFVAFMKQTINELLSNIVAKAYKV